MLEPTPNFTGISCTINSTMECNLRCKYDLPKGTKILLADLSEKNIEDVKEGDKLLAFNEKIEPGKNREFEIATVEAAGPTRSLKEAYVFKSKFGDVLIASGEHPVINQDNEFQKTEDFYKSDVKEKKILQRHSGGTVEFIPITIEKITLPEETQFYNLTTSSRTFIANNIFVHNCYEINKQESKISYEVVRNFIDRLLEDDDPIGAEGTSDGWISHSGIILDFIGGDSFMNPDVMDYAMSYFQYKSTMLGHPYASNWRASISSNGTLFGDPAVQKLIEKWGPNLSIGISIDGCKEIHDAYRIFRDKEIDPETGEEKEVGTMDTIMKWWKWIGERQPDATNHTKSTCSKASIPYLYKSLKFMHEDLGITYVNQNFIMEDTGCTEEDYVLLDEMYRECAQYLFDHRHELYWSMYDKSGLNKRSDNLTDFLGAIKKGWCGSGAMPSVGMSGKIYPCFRWLPHTQEDGEEQADEWSVGNVWEGFNHKERFRRVKEATREKISQPYCLECEYEGACAYCIGGCYSEFHKFKRTEHICDIAKLRSKWARRYWDMVEEEEHNHDDYFKNDKPAHYERIVVSEKLKDMIEEYDRNGDKKSESEKMKAKAIWELYIESLKQRGIDPETGKQLQGHGCVDCDCEGDKKKEKDELSKIDRMVLNAKQALSEKRFKEKTLEAIEKGEDLPTMEEVKNNLFTKEELAVQQAEIDTRLAKDEDMIDLK